MVFRKLRLSSCTRASRTCILVILAIATAFSQPPGISGTLTDQKGKPIQGAWVTAVRQSVPPASATIASDANGGFSLPNLPAGSYRLCAQTSAGDYIDPCWWSSPMNPSLVTVRQGATTTGVTLKLASAATLQVRINDPQGHLSAGSASGRNVLVGIMTSAGVFRNAVIKSKDAAGHLLEVPVPFDQPVRLSVQGNRVALTDSTGKSVPASGFTTAFTRLSNEPVSIPIVLTVSGLIP